MGSISQSTSLEAQQQEDGKDLKYMESVGKRLLPAFVDQEAVTNPDRVLGLIAKPSTSTKTPYEFTELTISQLANAVNYMAAWLEKSLCESSQQTIGFVGLQDFRYTIMELAAMKTGHVVLLPSSRNAASNTIDLLEATNCAVLFYSGPGSPVEKHVKKLQSTHGSDKLHIHPIPEITEMLSRPAPLYPYTKTYEQAKNDIVIILHTSGSTGIPKPIPIPHAFLNRTDTEEFVPDVPGKVAGNFRNLSSPMYNGSPFFHLSGVCIAFRAIFAGVTVVIGPPDVPATPKMACDVARSIELQTVMAAPHVVDALFLERGDELKECFGKLKHVIWFGAPLAHSTGDWIVNHLPNTHLWQFYGSTEMAWFPVQISPKTHWSYLDFHPLIGPLFEAVPHTDLHELVIRRHPNHPWSTPIFFLFPGKQEWRSRDLFRRCEDPGREHLWKFESRLDDIFSLNTASKVNPLHVEVKLQSHPLLDGVLVFGQGRTRCGILVEVKEGVERVGVVDRVWGDIERANMEVPEHARVERRLVIVAEKEKPFVRAAKGNIVRSVTTKLYEREIDEVYEPTT